MMMAMMMGLGGCVNIINSADPFGDGSLIHKYLLNGDTTDVCGNQDGVEHDISYEDAHFEQGAKVAESKYISVDSGFFDQRTVYSLSFWEYNTQTGNDYDRCFIISGLFYYYADDYFGYEIPGVKVDSDNRLTPGVDRTELHHYVITVDDGHCQLFVDGVFIDEFTGTAEAQDITSFEIGTSNTDYEMIGTLDTVEFYNRVLTEDEAKILYEQCK